MNPDQPPFVSEPGQEKIANSPEPLISSAPTKPVGPDNPPWGIPLATLTWLLSVIMLLVIPVLTALPYLIYRLTVSGPQQPETLLGDKNFIFFSVLGVIPAHILTLGVAWLVITKRGKYPLWQTLGWKFPPNFGPITSVLTAIALFAVGLAITWAFGGKETDLERLINSSYQTRLATAFLAAVTGPLVEEVVYRGVLYSALQRAIGVAWAITLVSTLFAGVHVYQYRANFGVIAAIVILSVSLTTVRALTGQLLPSFVIHLVFNGIQSVMIVFDPFLNRFLPTAPEKVTSLHLLSLYFRHLS